MILLMFVAAAALAYHLWTRVASLESTIVDLTARVTTLEDSRARAATPAVAAPAQKPTM